MKKLIIFIALSFVIFMVVYSYFAQREQNKIKAINPMAFEDKPNEYPRRTLGEAFVNTMSKQKKEFKAFFNTSKYSTIDSEDIHIWAM